MPLYEYQCARCGRFELIRKFSDEPLAACPTCQGEVQKLLSSPAIQFKGTGWYVTDYAKSGAKPDTGKPAATGEKSADSGSKESSSTATTTASDSSTPKTTTSSDSSASSSSPTK